MIRSELLKNYFKFISRVREDIETVKGTLIYDLSGLDYDKYIDNGSLNNLRDYCISNGVQMDIQVRGPFEHRYLVHFTKLPF